MPPPESIQSGQKRRSSDSFHADGDRIPGEPAKLESPVALARSQAEAVDLPADFASAPAPGSRFGPYRIEAAVGKGGMGEVWKAHDSRLKRDVAIKFSARRFGRTFEREAQAIAALNHPNICSVYDIGPNYLVMELVEGLTLAKRISRGPVSTEESLAIARQIVDALEAAHEKGIVHSDLKPANIMIRPDGSLRVLDFGLARRNETAEVNPDLPTLTMTLPGTIMGTPGYMPPEQVRGENVDKRADIWAFGVVLYELVTGRQPFEARTTSDTMAAVMRGEPDWTIVPLRFHQLLRWCLEKDPASRLRDICDARRLLNEDVPAVIAGPRPQHIAVWAVSAVFALAAIGLAFIHFREKPVEMPVMRLSIVPPEGTSFQNTGWTPPAASPDGRDLVFQAISHDGKSQLWIRPLDSLTAHPLAGTEGGRYPFWCPDNKSIGFFADGKLKKIDVSGGPPTTLADAADPRGGTWNESGTIVFAPTPYGLQQISSSGGPARDAIPPSPKTATRFPWFLPDGRHFTYLSGIAGGDYSIHIATLDSSAEARVLPGNVDSQALYSQSHLLFLRGNTLMSQPFDSNRLAFTADAVPVAEQIQVGYSVVGLASFTASTTGILVYRSGLNNVSATWLDRAGKRLGTVGDPGILAQVSLSPDGKTAAVLTHDTSSAKVAIWLFDLLRGPRTLFASPGSAGAWSPDGRTIVFQSNRSGRIDLYRKRVDGSGDEELLYANNREKTPGSFSPDGRLLVYTALDPETSQDIWILPDPLESPGTQKPYPFLQTAFNEQGPRFSPDGRWIAYYSNESARNEVYVAPFPGPGGKVRISTGGGTQPRWRADGRELFYIAPGGRMMAAEVEEKGGTFAVKTVGNLFGSLSGFGSFEPWADGQRFLTLLPPEGESGGPLTVVQNWIGGLSAGSKK